MIFVFRCVLSCTNLGMAKLWALYSKLLPNCFINQSLLIFHSNLWHVISLINHSNQLLVYCIHQSATGDTRENLDFAVFRQNRV